jgi:putative ABC transport system ATP-binding protein
VGGVEAEGDDQTIGIPADAATATATERASMNTTSLPVLEARGIRKQFSLRGQRLDVLNDASLQLPPGRVTALTGRSGSGKTTLLQVVGLLATPDSGSVLIHGHDTSGFDDDARTDLRQSSLGFVFQAFNLLPQHSAVRNVALPHIGRWREGLAKALHLLERVGLADRAAHHPAELSAGEQQRVAIARALVNDPAALLADEPTGNLDAATEQQVLELFHDIARDGRAVLLVTHSDAVSASADRVLTMLHGAVTERFESHERELR